MSFQQANKDNYQNKIDNLDSSQSQAVFADADNVVIKAPAGSGKTHTLLAAVANYRYEHLNDRICAITFTRAARQEMEVRLREMGIYDVEVTTIHVWARNLLEYFADKHDFRIQVLNEAQIKQILQEIVRDYLVRARIRSVNINILYTYITGNKTMDITDNYRRTLRALEERYIMYKRNNNLYDFTDYPLYLWDIMELYDEYVNTIDALFVDELQDVDPIQFKIFERVNSNKKFFIGDAWQSIYVFRGSDGEIFDKLDDFHLCKLKYNYRSYQEIIDYASTIYMALYDDVVDEERSGYISQINWSNPSSIQCKKKYGGEVIVINPYEQCIVFKNNEKQVDSAYRQLRKIMDLNPMILCRTNKQVKTIQEFGITNVSTIHQAKGLEYDYVVVIDTEINCLEDLNVAYVALTRAKDGMLVINFSQFENFLKCQEKTF